jgi:hypothetical protein
MKTKKINILLNLFVIIIMAMPLVVDGQIITGIRHLRVGELWHHEESDASGEWEQGYVWPGNIWYENPAIVRLSNACSRASNVTFGAKNWVDIKKKVYPYFIGGPYVAGLDLKIVLRREPPITIVDGVQQVPRQAYDEIDPELISDAMLVVRFSTQNGITTEMRWYAYACKNADSYMMLDIVLLNNGNALGDEKRLEYRNQILHDVAFSYNIQQYISQDGATEYTAIWEDRCDDWVEYYGENYLDYIGTDTPAHPTGDPGADSLRLFIMWDGDNNLHPEVDDTGDPTLSYGYYRLALTQGQFRSQQYLGMGILHADKSADDESNDLSQPFSTVWRPQTKGFSSDQDRYNFIFSGDHMDSPQEMGYTEPNDPTTVARPICYPGVGPYEEMPYMSDVHIVMLIAVNGLSYVKCAEHGRQWWEQRQGGEGITDMEKNALLATGRDSLFRVYSAATRRYFRNIEGERDPFDAPDPPPAPDLTVTAGEKSVLLEWSDVSGESDPDTETNDFAGYRVYRSLGRNDTTFTRIWECGGNSGIPVTTSYSDETVQRGFAYFYYVTAYDDGSQNWEQPGVSLESGKLWNMMQRNQAVHPFLTKTPVSTLDDIKVIPNPYHDLSERYNYPGEPNKILFINIPPECTIKIYTMSGDLVMTLHHTDGTSEESWNQVTEHNQLIYTGVYIYAVESDMGDKIGKFVIVRTSTQEGPPQ